MTLFVFALLLLHFYDLMDISYFLVGRYAINVRHGGLSEVEN